MYPYNSLKLGEKKTEEKVEKLAKPKVRNSNLELLRIISMLLVVSHHFVVNSGITENYNYEHITLNMLFLQLFGMWGKTAINIFVLISGYFMCTSKLTIKRFSKVFIEAKFYRIAIFVIFVLTGYEQLTVRSVINVVFEFLRSPNRGFTSSFLMFYLFVPFFNSLIEKMNRNQFECLLGLLLVYYTIIPTFMFTDAVFYEPVWFMVLYFVAAYIRFYPAKWMQELNVCIFLLVISIITSYASVFIADFLNIRILNKFEYFMVENSNKLLAFLVALFLFLSFKNIKMQNSSGINTIAATTFGVLCIHASSDAMRKFLWKDVLNVSAAYNLPFLNLVAFSICSSAAVFIICSFVDYVRIRFVEKFMLNGLSKYKWFNKVLY